MERSKIEVRETTISILVNLGEFCALGIYYANERQECPGFWIGDYVEPEILEKLVQYFSKRYHFHRSFVYN